MICPTWACTGRAAAMSWSASNTPGTTSNTRQRTLRPKKELQRAFYEPSNVSNRPLDLIFVVDQLERVEQSQGRAWPSGAT